jgi:hypothetical protein
MQQIGKLRNMTAQGMTCATQAEIGPPGMTNMRSSPSRGVYGKSFHAAITDVRMIPLKADM